MRRRGNGKEQSGISINATSIETGLWVIQRYLMERYGVDEAAQDVAPLSWYINTGRAPVEFIRMVLTTKPYMIGRTLHEGGTYDEAIQRVKDYIGFVAE